ncbi:MAG: DNA-protecting protein DprA, partial [Clostridia bacterium]|nr:DNA-protecting protein DprA [Clostridia bacterium]
MQGAFLREEISKNGAVISEFSPFAPASKTTFPIRNRIISGISRGVLVVEAGERSGSIITANCAMLQGRDVFAVPGSVVSSAYIGANRLIRDGASAVTCAQDIIDEYEALYPGQLKRRDYAAAETARGDSKPAKVIKKSTALMSEKEKTVYARFGSEPLYPGDIAAATGLSLGEVNEILTALEINDYVISVSGGRFTLI